MKTMDSGSTLWEYEDICEMITLKAENLYYVYGLLHLWGYNQHYNRLLKIVYNRAPHLFMHLHIS